MQVKQMSKAFQSLVKVTGWPIQLLCFRKKIYYENKEKQGRKIKGPAIIISNHTSVYDYAVMLFVFHSRYLRYLMAELLFNKKGLGGFLKAMGGIKVDRDSFNFSFIGKSLDILEKGGVVGVFPEGRLPKEGESRPIEFKPSSAYLAYLSGVPVIPVYTDGSYFNKKRAHVLIGEPIDVESIIDKNLSEKENIEKINNTFRQKVIELEHELEKRKEKK